MAKNNPLYIIVERKGRFYPVLIRTGVTHGPSGGLSTKEVCQHWINTAGDR